MHPSLDVARAHVRVLELDAERLRHRTNNPATRKRLRNFLKGRTS